MRAVEEGQIVENSGVVRLRREQALVQCHGIGGPTRTRISRGKCAGYLLVARVRTAPAFENLDCLRVPAGGTLGPVEAEDNDDALLSFE